MSTSAHERMRYLANWFARDIANSLFQKWAIKGFFTESPCRVLSLVLSFASKESTAPLGAAAPPSAPESARHAPRREKWLAPTDAPMDFPLALWKPSGTEAGEKPRKLQPLLLQKIFAFGSEQNDLPRGKPSAQPALPCTPLVVCLNSEPLTTYDGCIHRTRTFLPCPQKIPLLLFSKIRAKIIPLCG